MSEPIRVVKSALGAYANWDDRDIRQAIYNLLDELDNDLNIGGYNPSSDCEEAVALLQDTMDEKLEEEEVTAATSQEAQDKKEDAEVEKEVDREEDDTVAEVDEDDEDDEIPEDEMEEDLKLEEELD